jgi:hypothetical protein
MRYWVRYFNIVCIVDIVYSALDEDNQIDRQTHKQTDNWTGIIVFILHTHSKKVSIT